MIQMNLFFFDKNFIIIQVLKLTQGKYLDTKVYTLRHKYKNNTYFWVCNKKSYFYGSYGILVRKAILTNNEVVFAVKIPKPHINQHILYYFKENEIKFF